jgi:hypothetical protein
MQPLGDGVTTATIQNQRPIEAITEESKRSATDGNTQF